MCPITEIQNILNILLINNEKTLINKIINMAFPECECCYVKCIEEPVCVVCDESYCEECVKDRKCADCDDPICLNCECWQTCEYCENRYCLICAEDTVLWCEECECVYCVNYVCSGSGFYRLEVNGESYTKCGGCVKASKIN